MTVKPVRKIQSAVIVAHPDDETLWAGGTILGHPSWEWLIISLCRAGDENRAPRFRNTLKQLYADGIMGYLDDGPDQTPLEDRIVRKVIVDLLPQIKFDLVLTHDPLRGEYTRHRRHEETGRAVIGLWETGKITTNELWMFAYTDDEKRKLPQPDKTADYIHRLVPKIWAKKYHIITETYGFDRSSFEARTTPRKEAFRCFRTPRDAAYYLWKGKHEI